MTQKEMPARPLAPPQVAEFLWRAAQLFSASPARYPDGRIERFQSEPTGDRVSLSASCLRSFRVSFCRGTGPESWAPGLFRDACFPPQTENPNQPCRAALARFARCSTSSSAVSALTNSSASRAATSLAIP